MENVNKLLYHAISVLIFAIGIYFLIIQFTTYNKVIKSSKEVLRTDIIYQQEVSNEDIIPYSKIIASLCMPLEYNIQINELMIYKNNHQVFNIPEYEINQSNYKRSYQYDNTGALVCVIYTSYTG